MYRRQFLQQLSASSAAFALGVPLAGCGTSRGGSSTDRDDSVSASMASADSVQTRNLALNDSRMAWWRDARFGMFIHFGLYSQLGGEWQGKRAGSHEWIRNNYKIPHEEYIRIAERFNPARFDANAWVLAAKNAGQKYIVFTIKHHEGFSLYDSKVTEYDVMSTPFRRDIARDIANACRRHDMRIGWYYSIMDWYHADYLPRRDWEKRDATGADFVRYVQFMKDQLRELLINYGDISVLWFDGQWERTWNHALGVSLYEYCRALAPNVVINDRVDAGVPNDANIKIEGAPATRSDSDATAGGARKTATRKAGDFTTPEQQVPTKGLPGVDWESCVTMNENWGYSKFDHNYKSVDQLVRLLVETASKGGNLLLNVGPMGNGAFPQESTDALRGIGDWMRVNGNAIYGSRATPFANAPVRITAQTNRLNLFVDAWKGGALELSGLMTRPARVFLNEDPSMTLSTEPNERGVKIVLPDRGPRSRVSVIALEFDSGFLVREN